MLNEIAGVATAAGALLAGVSLAHAEWVRRQTRNAVETQGIVFSLNHDRRRNPEDVSQTLFAPGWIAIAIRAKGPGTRYDVYTFTNGLPPEYVPQQVRRRFDNTSEPIWVEFQMPADVDRSSAWVGFQHTVVHGSGLRSEFVRVNIATGKMQQFRRFRTAALRRWWQHEPRLSRIGSGQLAPLGHWKDINPDTTQNENVPPFVE